MKKILFTLGAALTTSFILLSLTVLVNHSVIPFTHQGAWLLADGAPLPPAPPPPPPPPPPPKDGSTLVADGAPLPPAPPPPPPPKNGVMNPGNEWKTAWA